MSETVFNTSIYNICTQGFTTENAIMRLVFHDCVRYTDGTGGCDGCLNWGGVGDPHPNPNDVTTSVKYFSTSAQYFQTGSIIIFYMHRPMTSLPSSR